MSEQKYSDNGLKLLPVGTEPTAGDKFVFIGDSDVEKEMREAGEFFITKVRSGSGRIYDTNLPRPWGPLRRECFFGNAPESEDKFFQCRIVVKPDVTREQERDAELATLRQKLAEAEKERDARKQENERLHSQLSDYRGILVEAGWIPTLHTSKDWRDHVDQLADFLRNSRDEARVALATAEADCAALREALEKSKEDFLEIRAHASTAARDWIESAATSANSRVCYALTRPTGQGILDELSAARKVCEIGMGILSTMMLSSGPVGMLLTPIDYNNLRDALAAYDAARKANTGAGQ